MKILKVDKIDFTTENGKYKPEYIGNLVTDGEYRAFFYEQGYDLFNKRTFETMESEINSLNETIDDEAEEIEQLKEIIDEQEKIIIDKIHRIAQLTKVEDVSLTPLPVPEAQMTKIPIEDLLTLAEKFSFSEILTLKEKGVI